jgi:hypothetical protein
MGWRRMQAQAGVSLANPECWIDANDLLELVDSAASEVPQPGIVGTELRLQALPRNQRGFPEIAHPVGEPDVEVDGKGRSS